MKEAVNLKISTSAITQFCERWQITEFALFGSILRDDFRPDSDVDVMVTFTPQARWTLLDMVYMQEDLKQLFGRPVDLVERTGVEANRNAIRRDAILSSAEVIYVA